jgi:hypothetical protein
MWLMTGGYDDETKKRSDIQVRFNGVPTLVEIGVVNPSAKSYRSLPPGAVADKYGAMKIAKHRMMPEERDGVILPFIVESSGGFGQHTFRRN